MNDGAPINQAFSGLTASTFTVEMPGKTEKESEEP